jgi:hypothetical protein
MNMSSILLANSEMRPLCAWMPALVQGQMSPFSPRLPGVKCEFANSIELTLNDSRPSHAHERERQEKQQCATVHEEHAARQSRGWDAGISPRSSAGEWGELTLG